MCNAEKIRDTELTASCGFLKLHPSQKINLILCRSIDQLSEIKLIRTDTTLDHSQKAEKVIQTSPKFSFYEISGEVMLWLVVKRPRRLRKVWDGPVCNEKYGADRG